MPELCRLAISVRGVVQGVGFRPFVYRLAHAHGLKGWVLNHSGGVEIEVEGPAGALAAFQRDLERDAPPQARIEGIAIRDVQPVGETGFGIRDSVAEEGRYQLISPDIATCADCRRELFDPADRRYRYPFTNCTNCGPRFTIITDIPYDRPLTTMRDFVMCRQCQAEYDDPLDRRFHAQPNACPVCGPQVWFQPSAFPFQDRPGSWMSAVAREPEAALEAACALLLSGGILAVKGLGGFHLACDATDDAAVARLRARKQRPAKPLAVMLETLGDVHQHCLVSVEEKRLLTSAECPIVLLQWKAESDICHLVAPGNAYLGVMLPYTPLHHVLLRDSSRPLVMTSGNLSEEPIAAGNDEALLRLSHLADGFLLHNRDIHARYDDSVWFVPSASGPEVARLLAQPVRRARGYAPFPIRLPFRARQILACGTELKNTFCVTRDEYAFLSQHIGDLENLETLEHYEATVGLYEHLFRIRPELIAHDMHPEYLSTKYAKARAAGCQPLVAVQHHHAHTVSCLVDNAWPLDGGPVIGVAWDGTGFGTDERIWGGEFLVADYRGFQRAGHLEYLPMPGGEAAIRNPYRLAIGYLYALTGQAPLLDVTSPEELSIIQQQIDQGINCPQTSAGGRLFDAVSALLGVCRRTTYDAQAAIELEIIAQASRRDLSAPSFTYPFTIEVDKLCYEREETAVIRLREVFEALLTDQQHGVPVAEVAYRFHVTMAEMIAAMCERIARESELRTVALSGGCFQNRLLLSLVVSRLQRTELQVLTHRLVPCNDGGVSLGQAAIAHWTCD